MKCTKDFRLKFTIKAKELVSSMTLEEKVHWMSGLLKIEELMSALGGGGHYNDVPYPAGGDEKRGIPPMLFVDGPRGAVCGVGESTCFPVSMLRGATFDTDLEEEIGKAIGREIRGFGGNLFGGVCINLPYNPGWGRSQEVYSEESFALGQFGSALTRGVQEENVIACVKHYAFNSMEISRFKVSVDCERRTEREVYLPHFKDCVDAGAASVMSAYNLYKGVHAGHSDYLLRKVLKEEWDFDGFVMSDFVWGVKDTVAGANNGEDMEMCSTIVYGDKLVQAVRDGLVDESRIDDAALRIVRTLLAFDEAYKESGNNYGKEVLGCKEHVDLALRAAQQGITLLQNNNKVLPLDKTNVKRVAVLGELADTANIGDHGSSRVFPAYVVTPLEGLKKLAPQTEFVYCKGDDLEKAKEVAAAADAVVFVVGYNADDEGEYISGDEFTNYTGSVGGDRVNSLGLHQNEIDLIKAVGPVNKNSTVVLIGGNMIMITEWMDSVSSIIMAYYPGQEGGTAIAQILFGDINPSGKIPFVLPYEESHLPQVNWNTTNQFYEYYHGYAKLEKEGIDPLRPYGFGLSFTTFDVTEADFSVSSDCIEASCTITNTGDCDGAEVVQLYIGFSNSKLDRPVKLLRGFKRIELAAGESKNVTITCPLDKIQYFNARTNQFVLEKMEYEVYIGTSASSTDLVMGKVSLV